MLKTKLVIFILLLCGTIFAAGRQETVDMEICIVDSITGMPIPNISVIYMLQKVTGLFVDGTFTIIESTQYTTDENGIIFIPKRRVASLKMNERLYSSHIYVNIDLEERYKSESLNGQHFNLGIIFLNNFTLRHVFPNPYFYSASISTFFLEKKRMIYTQINDDNDVRRRIQRRTYALQDGEQERIVLELVRREGSTNSGE